MLKKLRVGIAGFGVVGRRRKKYLDAHPNAEVIAVYDIGFETKTKLVEGAKAFNSFNGLIDEDLDALFVCTPNNIAPEITIKALCSGFHVFCEKPPGRSVADMHLVLATEKQNPSLKLMYGFNHRYHDSVQDALEIVKSGELGSVINIRALYGKAKLITFNQPNWRTKREIAGGGVLLDQGIHIVDLMRLFGGEFTEVSSIISNSHWGYDVEDNAYALMRTENGVVGMLNSSATQWRHKFHLDINLSRGSLILGGILSGTKSYGAETLTVSRSDPDNDYGDPLEQKTRYNHDPSWKKEVDIFVESILKNKPIKQGNSEDALRTMQLVFDIYYQDKRWREKFDIPNPYGSM